MYLLKKLLLLIKEKKVKELNKITRHSKKVAHKDKINK
jgi:hypothetical protein